MILDLLACINIVDTEMGNLWDIEEDILLDVYDLARVNGLTFNCNVDQIADRKPGDNV